MIVREMMEQLSKVDPELEILVSKNQDIGFKLAKPEIFIQERYASPTVIIIS